MLREIQQTKLSQGWCLIVTSFRRVVVNLVVYGVCGSLMCERLKFFRVIINLFT